MFSSHPSRLAAFRPGALRLVVLVVFAALVVPITACGKKGDPMPAPRILPQAATDLKVRQRGLEVVVEFAYPKATVAGLPLPGLDAITLFELDRPIPAATAAIAPAVTAPAPTAEGAPAAPSVPPAPPALPITPPAFSLPDSREFALAAKPVLALTGGELASAISGDRVTVRFRLTEPFPAAPLARIFAVRTHAVGGELSNWSNLAGLMPRLPPPSPSGFLAVAAKDGVELSWNALPAAAPSASAPEVAIVGYNIYRRDAARASYGDPITTLDATATASVDRGVVYGRRYIYAVAAIGSRAPLAESAFSVEREIDYQDRFAPAPPPALSALGSVGEVRLVWQASPDPDVVGYVIERADPDAGFHRVNAEPVAELELTDRGLSSGFVFRFRVAAIDKSGNLGAPCEPVATRVP